jgi:PAS domain S-box-containing protein
MTNHSPRAALESLVPERQDGALDLLHRPTVEPLEPLDPRDPLADAASLADAVVRGSVDGFAVLDRETRYTLWNPAMERFTGKAAAEVLGRRAGDVFPSLRDHGLEVALQRVLKGEPIATDGVQHVQPDGTRRVYDRLYLPLRDARAEITGVLCIVRDATARYAAQEALRTTETKLLMAAEAAGIGLWTWDPVADVITWEDTMCGLYGRAPGDVPKGRDEYLTLIHPEDRELSKQRIARGRAEGHWEHEYRIIRPDGTLRWLASRTRVVRTDRGELVLGAVFDVTERREMEERQRATQRLEVVGQLTAGIAHNFNNLLMGILPTLELASKSAPADLIPLLRVAEESAERAASVVRQLMTYASRNQAAIRRSEQVAPLVERVAGFCRTTFERRISIAVRCMDAGAADMDPSQIEQAILNLLINARDALEDGALVAPTIEVVVEAVPAGARELEGRAGDWIAVRVVDNGIGMDAATMQRIYEPFFTTKPAGKGTGLGLATTHAIARDHGGFITCQSAPGRGTMFALHLPCSSRRLAPPAVEPTTSPALTEGALDAVILVVDDDDSVRAATRRILESAGFVVETAASGDEALARMADPSTAARVDLVLLDVSMPGTSGPDTRRRLAEMVPGVPVVLLTGYAYQASSADTVLEKPVTQAKLVSCLRETLSRAAAQGLPGEP